MRGPQALLLLFGAGAFVGAAVGLAVGSAWTSSRTAALEDEVAALRDRSKRLADDLRAVEQRNDRGTGRARVSPVAPPAEDADDGAAELGETATADANGADAAADPADDPAVRAARVRVLSALQPVWFERGDGDAALDALRELAALTPDGREAAMQLALAINADVSGEGRLALSDVAFYSGLADPAIKGLMDWALQQPETPAGFRVMAAYSLPWTQAPEQTREQFAAALQAERDTQVQRALVANLGRLRDPEAERLLGSIFTDPSRDGGLRAQVAAELAATEDAGLVRALETAAEGDDDPAVRDAARAALVARDPPASGYLVTGTLPESQAAAAGIRAGDVLVTYDGRATLTVDELRAAAGAAEGREAVEVVVVREGREVTLSLRPGRLGVFGRAVEAREP